ncbi:DcrB-related protein [Pantoea sp.]|uniref:DcrB-related protein n=1 Tax=Pantoea sp. TaxID=69393 RepID=UPI0028A2409F|nr:DcrB-related protein [Pantoea sp.]
MSSKKMTYTLYEGTFTTEVPVMDHSVNILMFRDPDEKEYNIVINRTYLDKDQTLESFCEKEMDALRKRLPAFEMEGKMLKSEIGPLKLSVIQVANQYINEGKVNRQVQSAIQLPFHAVTNPDSDRIIIFTLNSTQEFTEHQRKHYVKIINSFAPFTSALKVEV